MYSINYHLFSRTKAHKHFAVEENVASDTQNKNMQNSHLFHNPWVCRPQWCMVKIPIKSLIPLHCTFLVAGNVCLHFNLHQLWLIPYLQMQLTTIPQVPTDLVVKTGMGPSLNRTPKGCQCGAPSLIF